MFHQSFKGNPKWGAMKELTRQEIYKFADPPFMKQMLVIQLNDSNSYTFLGLTEKVQQELRDVFIESNA